MTRLIPLTALFAMMVPIAGAADDDAAKAAKAAKTAKEIEGDYEIVSATRSGKPDPFAKKVLAFTIKEGKIIIKRQGNTDVAKFKLNPVKKPAEIDITPADEKLKEKVIQGIYESKATAKGFELSIAFGREGIARPKDFKGEGAKEVSLKLLRKKGKTP